MRDLKKGIKDLIGLIQQAENEELLDLAKFLRQRINQPDAYVVLLGESSSGKSLITNSILQDGILPVSGIPTTAAITEVYINAEAQDQSFAVINKNATMEILDKNRFRELVLNPDENVSRMRATIPAKDRDYAGVRLFDTPGYGSLVEAHDEVLTEFLPNCDAVIYVISYRVGFQNEDHEFVRSLLDVTRDGIPFYLVINMCPPDLKPDNRRVAEIKRYVQGLLMNTDVPVFTIPFLLVENNMVRHPAIDQLQDRILQDLNAPDRKATLNEAFSSFLGELAAKLRANLEGRLRACRMSEQDADVLRQEQKDLTEKIDRAVETIIKPGFQKIYKELPHRVSESRARIEESICNGIHNQSASQKDEMIAYTNNHLLPLHARRETGELTYYLQNELERMDEELENYLNTAIIQFEKRLEVRFMGEAGKAAIGAARNVAEKLANSGLLTYFMKFGGKGGVGAGIPNAASHLLKKVGDLFGKKFSRNTHNALKHFLKKVGLNSAKAVGAVVSGVIELASLAIEYSTWKPILIRKVKNGLESWENDMVKDIEDDLQKLEKENINHIAEISAAFAEVYTVEEKPEDDPAKLEALLVSLEAIEKEIEYEY